MQHSQLFTPSSLWAMWSFTLVRDRMFDKKEKIGCICLSRFDYWRVRCGKKEPNSPFDQCKNGPAVKMYSLLASARGESKHLMYHSNNPAAICIEWLFIVKARKKCAALLLVAFFTRARANISPIYSLGRVAQIKLHCSWKGACDKNAKQFERSRRISGADANKKRLVTLVQQRPSRAEGDPKAAAL